ncbi:MAG: ATP-binding protein [Pirellulales bacterium]
MISFDPSRLDVSEIESGQYGLFYGDRVLHTLPGKPVSHRSQRLLFHIRDELDSHGLLRIKDDTLVKPHFNSSYTILGVEQELVASDTDRTWDFRRWLGNDPILHPCAGPEIIDQMARWECVDTYLASIGLHRLNLPLLYDDRSLHSSDEEYAEAVEGALPPQEYAERVSKEYQSLFPAQRAVTLHLNHIHHGLLLLPMVLAQGGCSSAEYANAALAAHAALSQAFPDATPSGHQKDFEAMRGHAETALAYIRASGVEPMMQRFVLGEKVLSDELRDNEFKEVKGANPVDAIKNTADEYVVAYLNSCGGRILWGIRDSDGVCVGVQLSYEQRDRVRREVVSKLKEIKPSIDPSQYRITLHRVVEGGSYKDDLFVVEVCVPSVPNSEPYYTGGNECFVRLDGVKKKLSGPELTDWIRRRITHKT